MVKCFAPGCTSGLGKSKEKVYLFKPVLKENVMKWAQMVPRLDRAFGENDFLCSKHFDEKDIIRTEIKNRVLYVRPQPKLAKNAIPKYFDDPPPLSPITNQHTVINNTLIKKPKICAACNCTENSETERKMSFYLFPVNPELRKEWISAAHLNKSNLYQFAYLCSKHFEENCFESVNLGTLKKNAIPSRFDSVVQTSNNNCPVPVSSSTGHTEPVVIDLTETSTENCNTETNSLPFCIVKSCKHEGNIRGITYHRIPTNNSKEWMTVLKNFSKIEPIPLDSKVCSMHFKAKDFIIKSNRIKLKDDAVPILNINENLIKESADINPSNPLSNYEIVEEDPVVFNESGVKKLRQAVLLSSVITPAADIVKSDFALIDINSIINKKIENEFNNTKTVTPNKNNSTQNLTVINAMHNYCNAQVVNKVSNKNSDTAAVKINVEKNIKKQLDTTKSVPNDHQLIDNHTDLNENDEYKKKQILLRKLRAYKKAYKKHKSLNRKQNDNILILEQKLEENVKKNKKLEHRIVILEDLIQNMLRKREENTNDNDKMDIL